jgi:hypothetical protein
MKLINSQACRLLSITFALALVAPSTQADILSFSDITFWVGTGDSEAALVIDWNDGNAPLLWGYRFNGNPTGEDLLRDVVAADPNLYIRVDAPGPFGTPLYGIGHDRNSDGFGISDGTTFTAGVAETGVPDGFGFASTSNDADDSYAEGWNTGFWGYYNAQNGGTGWSFASAGFSDRVLNDGDWDGWSFAPAFNFTDPSDGPAADASVPEPNTFAALLCGTLAMAAAFRRRNRKPSDLQSAEQGGADVV